MTPPHDVDNTLLHNNQIERDLRRHLEQAFGVERQARYWEIARGLEVLLTMARQRGHAYDAFLTHSRECNRMP